MLQEALRNDIETKLNDNTKNVLFVVGQYAKTNDDEKDFIYSYENGYRLIEKTYVPVMITTNIDYEPIPGTISGFATVNADFYIADDEDLSNKLTALDEVISKIVANSDNIVDVAKTYYNVKSMDAIIPNGNLITLNGRHYIPFSTVFYFDFSDTFLYGNKWRWFLDSVEIFPYTRKTQRKNEMASPQIIGEKEAKSLTESSIWGCEHVFRVTNSLSALIDELNGDYDISKTYSLKIISPTDTVGTTYTVKIESSSALLDLGEKASLSLTFTKAYVE